MTVSMTDVTLQGCVAPGGNYLASPDARVYNVNCPDIVADIVVQDYFIPIRACLRGGDIVRATGTDGSVILQVSSTDIDGSFSGIYLNVLAYVSAWY